MCEKKRMEFIGYEWEKIGGRWLVKIDDTFYELEWNDSDSLVSRLNEQQVTINKLREENASLKQRIRDIKYNNCGY